MGKKITQLATITEVADDDLLIGVDISDTSGSDDGTNKKFTKASLLSNLEHGAEVDNPSSGVHGVTGDIVGTTDTQTLTNKTLTSPLFGGTIDGWISAGETWTYASATTITVPSGAVSKYQKGDKIKITNNSATKYFYIVGVADTVLTVTGGTDYTVHDSAITNPFFSKIENPQGFPQYFAWTPTVSGTASMTYTSVTITGARFCLKGKTCFWCFMSNGTIGGTTNAYMTHTVPITGSSSDANYMHIGNGDIYGDGSAINQVVCSVWNSSSRSLTLVYKNTTNSFTAGAGRSLTLKGTYEIA